MHPNQQTKELIEIRELKTQISGLTPEGVMARPLEMDTVLDRVRAATSNITNRMNGQLEKFESGVYQPSSLFAEFTSFFQSMNERELFESGNIVTRLLSRTTTVSGYLRKRTRPYIAQMESYQTRLEGELVPINADKKKAAELWTEYNISLETLDDLRMAIQEQIDTILRSLGVSANAGEAEVVKVMSEQSEMVKSLLREAQVAYDRVSSQIFIMENHADKVAKCISNIRVQESSLIDCLECLTAMRGATSLAHLMYKSGNRSDLIKSVHNARQQLELSIAKAGMAFDASAARDAVRPTLTTEAVIEMTRLRKAGERSAERIFKTAARERGVRQGIMRDEENHLKARRLALLGSAVENGRTQGAMGSGGGNRQSLEDEAALAGMMGLWTTTMTPEPATVIDVESTPAKPEAPEKASGATPSSGHKSEDCSPSSPSSPSSGSESSYGSSHSHDSGHSHSHSSDWSSSGGYDSGSSYSGGDSGSSFGGGDCSF